MSDSLYERMGGDSAVNAAVELFYKKIRDDERIGEFFNGVDIDRLARKQKAFLTYAFGGPSEYTGQTLREAHANLVRKGLDDSHFDAVLQNLGDSLRELGVSEELIKEAADVAESVRNDVLDR
ncbi:group 1 truncated hemoglobin [Pseudomonadota bacterium]